MAPDLTTNNHATREQAQPFPRQTLSAGNLGLEPGMCVEDSGGSVIFPAELCMGSTQGTAATKPHEGEAEKQKVLKQGEGAYGSVTESVHTALWSIRDCSRTRDVSSCLVVSNSLQSNGL